MCFRIELKNELNVSEFDCARIQMCQNSCVLGLKASQATHKDQKGDKKICRDFYYCKNVY